MSRLGFMPKHTFVDGTINQWPEFPVQWYMSNILGSQTVLGGASTSQTANSAWVFPIVIDDFLVANQIKVPGFCSITSANTSDHYQMSQGMYLGFYQEVGSSLSLISSFSNQMTLGYTSNANSAIATASMGMQYGSGAGYSGSTTLSTGVGNATSFWSSVSGSKLYPFLGGNAVTFQPGQYYGVFAVSQNSATKNNATLLSVGHVSQVTQTIQDFCQQVASTTGNYPNMGLVSITQASNALLPGLIAKSDIKTASNNVTFVNRSLYIQINKT